MRAAALLIALVLLAGCGQPSSAPTTTTTVTDAILRCSGTPNQGDHGDVAVLGVESSPLTVAHETIHDHMDVEYPGWLNMTADWTVRGEGTVDLLVKPPGKPDEVVAAPPFALRLLDPPHGEYSITLQAHPVAYDVAYDMDVFYNYTFISDDGTCPSGL